MDKLPIKESLDKKKELFFSKSLWTSPLKDVKGLRYLFYKFVRVFYLAIIGIYRDLCFLRASSLTFYTAMSIVPVFAVSFALAKGFGYKTFLENQIYHHFSDQRDLVQELVRFSQNLIEQTKGGLIAGIGLVLLLWSVLKVMHYIESSMNAIWKVKKHRTFARKMSDYFAFMIIGPIFFLAASSTTFFIVGKLKGYIASLPLYETVSTFLLLSLKLAPYFLIWILFCFLYLFMPNTRVRFLPGVIGGVFAGTIYQITQWGYFNFQIGATNYNAIYGSFAAIPLFLIWSYISWLIFLWGVEISYAYQNVMRYEYGWKSAKLNHKFRLLLTLWILHFAMERFKSSKPAITIDEIYTKLEVPYQVVERIFEELKEGSILTLIEEKKEQYILTISLDELKIKDVMDLIVNRGAIPEVNDPTFKALSEHLYQFGDLIQNSDHNKLFREI